MSDYSKIVMKADKSQGSFVRDLQGHVGKGFEDGTHVHKDWWAKTKTYEQVMQDAHVAVENREDILTEIKNISCVSENDEIGRAHV